MPHLFFVAADGETRSVEGEAGLSVMEAARRADIPWIVAECGGACSCATCHVRVDADWFDRVGGPGAAERDMLDFAENTGETSRLSCQIVLSEALDGVILHCPA